MWNKVTKKMPEVFEDVLVYKARYGIKTGYLVKTHDEIGYNSWCVSGNSGGGKESAAIRNPTHWMPLPAPPKSNNLEEKQNDLTTQAKSFADATAEQICPVCKGDKYTTDTQGDYLPEKCSKCNGTGKLLLT